MTTEPTTEPPGTLDNGAQVVHYTETHPGGNGFRRHGIALCDWFGEYAVWQLYLDEDGRWQPEAGDYFRADIVAATKRYEQRLGGAR